MLRKFKNKDGFAARALDPALKGEVCRATDQLTQLGAAQAAPTHF